MSRYTVAYKIAATGFQLPNMLTAVCLTHTLQHALALGTTDAGLF